MKIQLSKGDLKAATQNWNTLVNSKNKNKNYCIPTSVEEYTNFDKFAARLQIGFQEWILLKNAITAFDEVFNRIHNASELKGIVSYETVYTALKKELEVEVFNRDKDPKCKREFIGALESIQHFIDEKISYYDFYFAVEGLELEDLEKISCDKVEIFSFNQELCDQMIAAYFGEIDSPNPEVLAHTQDFFNKNFLNRLCIKSTAYGDSDTANKKAYRQARELINYFRYILCLFMHDRVSEQMVKINLSFEAYGNSERTLIRRNKDDTIILVFGRGRKPLQTFPIDKNRLEDLSFNGFLDDFSKIINASSQTQLEGCILTAIYWIGEAQNETDLDVSFLKYWTALECIFTGTEQPTHALAKGVATLNAFSSYEFIRIEDAKEVYKNMTKLYDKRSNIIHRGMNYLANKVIDEADISRVCKYTAWSILSLFHLRSIGYTSMQEVGEQINRLYSQWNGQ
jgi:Apea-like HEPN